MLNKTLTIVCITMSCALLLSSLVHAQQLPPRGPIAYEFYDQDGNGFISQEEFNTVRQQRIAANAEQGRQMRGMAYAPTFSDLDLDGDGKLRQDELFKGQQLQMQKRREMQSRPRMPGSGTGRHMPVYSDFDLNADGAISEQEFIQARNTRIEARSKQGYPMRNLSNMPTFQSIDSNADGQVSQQEFSAHQLEHQQQMQMQREAYWRQMQENRNQPNYQGMQGGGPGRHMPVYSDFDLNADGAISEQEFIQARNTRIETRSKQGYPMRNLSNMPTFQSIDSNADGKISQQEFSTHQQEHWEQRQMRKPYY